MITTTYPSYPLDIKLNGYRPTHRNKWRFLQLGILKVQELALLEYYADIMGFDKRNSRYGLVLVNFKDIARIFKKSSGAVWLWHKRLLDVGLVKETTTRGVFSLVCHERYISPGKWQGRAAEYVSLEKNQPVEIMFQNFEINLQEIKTNFQPVKKDLPILPKKPSSIAIDSSRVESINYPVGVVVSQKPRTNEAYREMYRQGGFSGFTPDDMRWTDENMRATQVIPCSRLERDFVEVFFKGDWNQYQRHLLN